MNRMKLVKGWNFSSEKSITMWLASSEDDKIRSGTFMIGIVEFVEFIKDTERKYF